MPEDKIRRAKFLWWIAFGAQAIVTILETVEGDYLKAASASFLALAFLMLATGISGDDPDKSRLSKLIIVILVAASMALLVYRLTVGRPV